MIGKIIIPIGDVIAIITILAFVMHDIGIRGIGNGAVPQGNAFTDPRYTPVDVSFHMVKGKRTQHAVSVIADTIGRIQSDVPDGQTRAHEKNATQDAGNNEAAITLYRHIFTVIAIQ